MQAGGWWFNWYLTLRRSDQECVRVNRINHHKGHNTVSIHYIYLPLASFTLTSFLVDLSKLRTLGIHTGWVWLI